MQFDQTEYAKKYNKDHYKEIKLFVSEEQKKTILQYSKDHKLSQTKFLVAAAQYCIDNAIDIDELLSHLK